MVKWFATAIILTKQEKIEIETKSLENERKTNDNKKNAGKQRTSTNVQWYTHGKL